MAGLLGSHEGDLAQHNVHVIVHTPIVERTLKLQPLCLLQVAPESNTTHLVCRCNHLTSFGGNFIEAPNPIDFDKVFTEFANLAESGNISVLVTIACAFLLYFVVLVFARRADNRDDDKVSTN